MNQSPRIILHVGAPKCGSSALQSALSEAPVLQRADGSQIGFVVAQQSARTLEGWSMLRGSPLQARARRAVHGYFSWPEARDETTEVALGALLEKLWRDVEGEIPLVSNEGWIGRADAFAARHPTWFSETAPGAVEVCAFARPPLDWLNAAYWQWGVWSGLDFGRWVERTRAPYSLGEALARWAALPNTLLTLQIAEDVVSAFSQHYAVDLPKLEKRNAAVPPALIGFLLRNRRYRESAHDSAIEFIFQRWCRLEHPVKPWAILPRHVDHLREALREDVNKLFSLLPIELAESIRDADPRWTSEAPYHERLVNGASKLDDTEELAQLYTSLARGVASAAQASGRPTPQLSSVLGNRGSVHAWDVEVAKALEHLIALDEAVRETPSFDVAGVHMFRKAPKPPPASEPTNFQAPWLRLLREGTFPVGNDEDFRYAPQQIPLPNRQLRQTVSRPDYGGFYFIGESWALAVTQLLAQMDKPTFHVLDIGCGVGKTARFLALDTRITYTGFDIFKPAVDWCENAFRGPVGDRFRFVHYDGISEFYNPEGTISPQDYAFPVEDASVDVAFAASLFTHLYEDDMLAYLVQTARKLAPHGRALFSIKEAPPDASEDLSGTEQAIVTKRAFFVDAAHDCGLELQSAGHVIGGQRALVFKPAADATT